MLTLRKYVCNQKGLFLAELIIGMVIMIIIMGAIFGIMSVASKAYLYNSSQGGNVAGAREILDAVTDEIRYSTTISTPTLGQTASEMDYIVNNDGVSRKISIISGCLIINNGTTQKKLAINNMQSISFKYETIGGKSFMAISVQLKNSSYLNSPVLSSTVIVYLQELNI